MLIVLKPKLYNEELPCGGDFSGRRVSIKINYWINKKVTLMNRTQGFNQTDYVEYLLYILSRKLPTMQI